MDGIITFVTSAAKLIVAVGLAYVAALWFALIVWTYRDIETRSRSVVTQIFATLLVVLFFVPGAILYYVLRPRDTLDEAFQRSLEEEYLLQDLEDLPRCHECHRAIESDWIVCPSCHTELRHECPNCSHLVRVTWDICPYCATELEPAAARGGESSSIGRLTAMIRDRFGDHMGNEARPGEPVFPNTLPQGMPTQAQAPAYAPQYPQRLPANGGGHPMGNGATPAGFPDGPFPAPTMPFAPDSRGGTNGANGNGAHTELFPAARQSGAPYTADIPLDFGELPPLYVEEPRGAVNGNGNGNGHSNGNGNGNGRANGHLSNGPAPNGHIAGTNGSNGFHPNGNGAIPERLPGMGSIAGFGPLSPPPSRDEPRARSGEPVGPPSAPARRP